MVDLRRGRIYLTLDEKSFCARPTRLDLRGQDVFVLGGLCRNSIKKRLKKRKYDPFSTGKNVSITIFHHSLSPTVLLHVRKKTTFFLLEGS